MASQAFKCKVLLLMMVPAVSHAAIDIEKLVKVTPANNPKCIEYFNYRDDMYCSTTRMLGTIIDPHAGRGELQNIVFDDRPWQAVWSKKSPEISTIEYVVAGDSIDDWHELITTQFIANVPDNLTPKDFADRAMAGLRDSGFLPIVTFYQNTPEKVIFEFRIESPAHQVQDELQLITKQNNNLYILHYVIKKADMGQENRNKWVALLRQATIK